jgi:hypothetical protein
MTRWKSSTGRLYTDDRDWKAVNEEYVVRGEFLLDLEWVESWDQELRKMNLGKKGAPYHFPNSLIKLQAVWNQWIGVREVEGVTRKLVEVAQLPEFNDYSTISRRIRQIEIDFELPKTGFCSVSTDGTGMKMNSAGEYKYDKYGKGKKKKWLHVNISANPLTKDLLDIEVHIEGEGPSEPETAMTHMKKLIDAGITIDKFWGDGAFDVLALFTFLEYHTIESAIPPRENASKNANGNMRRLREVYDYQSQCWADWARKKNYGLRWLGTEGIFSAVKRIFGEKTRAKTSKNMCKEVKRRFWAYEIIRKYVQNKNSA